MAEACPKCGGPRYRQPSGKLRCLPCSAEKLRAYREENREKRKAAAAAYRTANREKLKAAKAAYRKENIERIRATEAAQRAAHPEAQRAAVAAYRARNPEKRKAAAAAYRNANLEKLKARDKTHREALSPGYVAITLRMPVAKLTPELLELKREQLKTHRCVKQLIETLKEKENE